MTRRARREDQERGQTTLLPGEVANGSMVLSVKAGRPCLVGDGDAPGNTIGDDLWSEAAAR